MLQQDPQIKLSTNLVYNRKLSQRSLSHRVRFSQIKVKEYSKLLIAIAWTLAGAGAFYLAIHFGVLALFSGYHWIGLSVVPCTAVAQIATGGVILCAAVGATFFSTLSAFCFKHISG